MNQPPFPPVGGYPPGPGNPPDNPEQGYVPPPGYGVPPPYSAHPAAYGAPPDAYGAAVVGPPSASASLPRPHPRAQTALVLGLLGWFFGLWLVCSIPAWVLGARALREIRANPRQYSGETEAKIGMWLGVAHVFLPILVVVGVMMALLVVKSGR
ncbi:MAG: hypothetical protein NVS3B20_08620 [Polyangiales bacterium]